LKFSFLKEIELYSVNLGCIVYSSGIDAKNAILQEDVVKNYELVVVVNEKNKDTDWAKAVKDAYASVLRVKDFE